MSDSGHMLFFLGPQGASFLYFPSARTRQRRHWGARMSDPIGDPAPATDRLETLYQARTVAQARVRAALAATHDAQKNVCFVERLIDEEVRMLGGCPTHPESARERANRRWGMPGATLRPPYGRLSPARHAHG